MFSCEGEGLLEGFVPEDRRAVPGGGFGCCVEPDVVGGSGLPEFVGRRESGVEAPCSPDMVGEVAVGVVGLRGVIEGFFRCQSRLG